jgi:hypothetical protein
MRLRSLWLLRGRVFVSLLLAGLAATWSVAQVSLSPLALTPRKHEMATATAHVVVDTPTSTVLDLRQNTYSIEGLRNRAVLLGNVAAGSEVRERIANRVGVPAAVLRVQPPLTREMTTRPAGSENARETSDILKSTDQYRLNLQVNPSVPVLDVYAQAPSPSMAAALANATVAELQGYLGRLAAAQRTPADFQVRLLPLGQAEGTVINAGVDRQVAALVFALAFSMAMAMAALWSRVRFGWRQAKLTEQATGS